MAVDIVTPQNPIDLYPGPPFKPQQQNVPGDFTQMDPVPDPGEESYVGHGRLLNRKALITGGDSGIGRAVAIAFAREGADVALNYLESEQNQIESTRDLVEGAGRKAVLLPGDLSDEAFATQLVEDAVTGLGGLDIIVNIAGVMPTITSIEDFDTATFDHVLRTNVHAMFWTLKAAIKHLQPGASIVNTSSIQGFQPTPDLVEYAISKGAIIQFTRGMAQQLAERGIRVNAVAPGPFWTPLQPSSVPNEKIESFGSESVYGRPGQPAELASTYVYLASQESSYTSGETVAVTGGRPAH
ncbi:SDR family oxidoreductase [Herbiconiux sp. SYSU D00978]|uniref:SDR family oxidoreductase n=1 Tax=Herbiconiux sp. SYSU D00978 TaxID=2812562 RepID=UPI001A9652C0|nr:SDR family oxidoreductase [Herbiconiux sp. SYSU D00978]